MEQPKAKQSGDQALALIFVGGSWWGLSSGAFKRLTI
jgi:hypothetical protein